MRSLAIVIAKLIVVLFTVLCYPQEAPMAVFDPLVNHTWKAEGQWGDGSAFKQQVSFEYALNKRIVIARTDGYTNEERTSFGRRNHGIRQYDSITGKIKFWEFDVFGGLSAGEVTQNGPNISYTYDYGNKTVTDLWERVNDSTYNFTVGYFNNGSWEQRFLETVFVRSTVPTRLEHIEEKLTGRWISKAWDGQLEEVWMLDENKHLLQRATYTEQGKVLYKASSKIERIDKELILFSIITGNNPKIFKASSESPTSITFENTEYGYPNKLVYSFKADGTYHRTISGIENGEVKNYTFEFKRLD
ncbi:MAG: hypothetical protein KJN76_11470 [Eudoraea sp.]|nr:hypothetical protein [Eudoraea sp.]